MNKTQADIFVIALLALLLISPIYAVEKATTSSIQNNISYYILLLIAFISVVGIIIVMLTKLKIIKFEYQLYTWIIGITIGIIIFFLIINTYQTTQTMKNVEINNTIAHLEDVAMVQEQFFIQSLDEQNEKLEIASLQDTLTEEELMKIKNSQKEYFEIFLMNSQGIIVNSTDYKQIGVNKSEDSYFIHARNKTYVKPLYFSEITNESIFVIATPFHNGVLLLK